MNAYKEYVFKLFKDQSSEKIANDSTEHAKVLYQAIFGNAKRQVCIFCDNMASVVFDNEDVCNSLNEALKRGVKFDISLQTTPERTRALALLKDYQAQVHIYMGAQIEANGSPVNFAVMDKCGYRFEYNSINPQAIACANDPEFANILIENFKEATQLTA